jgi:hypothetical protein
VRERARARERERLGIRWRSGSRVFIKCVYLDGRYDARLYYDGGIGLKMMLASSARPYGICDRCYGLTPHSFLHLIASYEV